jgi:hypothetical protein
VLSDITECATVAPDSVDSWPIEDDRDREDSASRCFVEGERKDFGEPGGTKVPASEPLRGLIFVVGELGDIDPSSAYWSPSAVCFQTNATTD